MTEETPSPAFKVGDVVRLKSGGFPMTVVCVDKNGLLDCVWHNAVGEYRDHAFVESSLIPAAATEIATGQQVPVETIYDQQRWPENTDWKTSRGL